MTIEELKEYLQSLSDEILAEAAEIVAETATEYYKETFKKKAFDGNPWSPAVCPRKNGSLLIDSGALLNSIRPAVVTPERVVISAGNDKVDYAQTHNEGFGGSVSIPAHIRHTKRKEVKVKAHTRRTNIPKRQFLGNSAELNKKIQERIKNYIESKK